ncbi:MAG: hypothetical protein ABI369_08395 [Acetobacteraceae bacterium]
MSAALSITPQPSRGALAGLLLLLAALGRAIRCPFDAVLAGMANAGVCIETLCELLELTRAGLDDHIVRLGLRAPSDKPARRRGARSWSKEDEQKALTWRAAGVHPEAIGANLSKPRSANAVRTKLRRMGQASPPRRALFRPDPAFFAAFSTTNPVDIAAGTIPAASCGLSAEPPVLSRAVFTSDEPQRPTPSRPVMFDPRLHGIAPTEGTRKRRPTENRQRDFGSFSVVGGSERGHGAIVGRRIPAEAPQAVAELPLPAVKPIPTTCEEVDFADLSWVASVKNPLAHELTVYVVGMLMMSGLYYQTAAQLVGKTDAAFRTLRTRMGVPIERDRKKLVRVFDLQVARETAERGQWIVVKSLRGEKQREGVPHVFFWKQKRDRNAHLSPVYRPRDPMFARQSPEMTIITRQMLDAEDRAQRRAFATASDRIPVREEPRRGIPCVTNERPSKPACPIPTFRAGSSIAASA